MTYNVFSGTLNPTHSLTQKKGHTHSHPIFGPCLLRPNGWMDEDAAWYGSRPRLRPHGTRRGPSSRERAKHPPLFSVHVYSIVTTVAHLSYCCAELLLVNFIRFPVSTSTKILKIS